MTQLIVTIDTEEEGRWQRRYERTGNTVENIRCTSRFQRLCNDFGVLPTYLVDAPVVENDDAVAQLRRYQEDGFAEIGSHVHPWCNPPFEEEPSTRNSFLCNLPEPLQLAKLRWLTDRIESAFGRRPTSFRAGRYGLDAVGARLLAELGYVADSSVIPFSDFSAEGGPNFQAVELNPYFPSRDDLRAPSQDAEQLVEVPVTVGFSRSNFEQADRLRRFASQTPLRQLKCVGLLDRTGIARRIKLSPEPSTARHMRQLIDARLAHTPDCLVLMFHSSSLMVGGSPYVRTKHELDRFFSRLESVFEHCRARGVTSTTLSQFSCDWRTAEVCKSQEAM